MTISRTNTLQAMGSRLVIGWCLLLLIRCGGGPANPTPPASRTVVFNTGFPLTARLSGVYRSKDDGREYVYFANAVTHKKLLFFTPDGQVVDTISLQAAVDSLSEVAGLAVLSLDSIVLASTYTNKLVLVNGDGNCTRSWDLTNELVKPNGLRYECWASPATAFMMDGSAYFEVSLVASSVDDITGSETSTVETYYHLSSCGPKMIRLRLLEPEPTLSWALDSFYFKIPPAEFAKPEIASYACTGNELFVLSKYSPTIQVLDPRTMQQRTKFTVRSSHTRTHIDGIQLREGQELNMQDSVDQRLWYGGYISAIQQDLPSGGYWITVVHEVAPSNRGDERGVARKFSLLKYDKDLHLVQEQVIDAKRYLMFSMLPLSSGTFMQRWEDQRTQMSGIHTFDKLSTNAN